MLLQAEELFENYCIFVLSLIFDFIKRTHGVIAMGVPLLLIVAVHFLPRWVSVVIEVLVVIPAAVGMCMFVIVILENIRRHGRKTVN